MINLRISVIPTKGSIPPNIRVRNNRATIQSQAQGYKKPAPRLDSKTLQGLWDWGKSEEEKVMRLIKILPPELPEYDDLLDRLGKLKDTLKQVVGQMAARNI